MMESCKNKKEKRKEKNTKEKKTYFVILELQSYTLTNPETNS